MSTQQSLSTAIFTPIVIVITAVLTISGFVSFMLMRGSLQNSLEERYSSIQTLFTNQVSDDLLSGDYPGVYSVCKTLIRDATVKAIEVADYRGVHICEVHEGELRNARWVSSALYFDDGETELAAIIKIAYSTDIISHISRQSVLFLTTTLVALFCIFFFVARRISSHLTLPIRRLVDRLKGGNLKTLATVSEDVSKSTQEVAILFRETEVMAQRIVSYQDELVQKTKATAVADVASKVAHDIRGPLSSLQTALRALHSGKDDAEKIDSAVNLAQLSSSRLGDIADDLLTKHQGNVIEHKLFSVHEVLDELIGEYSAQHDYQQIRFEKKYQTSAILLYGDRTKIQRACGNIVKNALEAMNNTGVLAIGVDRKGFDVHISITDTGPGMSKEITRKILHGGFTTGKSDGHGIGMKVVRDAIEEFNGNLQIDSQIGAGTTFSLIIPLPSTEQLQTARTKNNSLAVFKISIDSLKNNTEQRAQVLVIDDDPSMRKQWGFVLQLKGVDVIVRDSYEDFLRRLVLPGEVSAVIVDYHFDNSELSGDMVIAQLKKSGFCNFTLCTAEYWKPSIKQLGKQLDVKICPKPMPDIEIELTTFTSSMPSHASDKTQSKQSGNRVLVIDDSDDIHFAWGLDKARLEVTDLATFTSMEQCKEANLAYSTYDYAFVDNEIPQSQWKLEQTLSFLKQQGVKQVIVASGKKFSEHEKRHFDGLADAFITSKIPQCLNPLRAGLDK